jgi:pimeloyl-ACP methyl ester carboxylesterase
METKAMSMMRSRKFPFYGTLPLVYLLLAGSTLNTAVAFAPKAPSITTHHHIASISPSLRQLSVQQAIETDTTEHDASSALQPPPRPTPKVQRHYETFLWKHEQNNYKINYRVEGPVAGPPILLVHGFGANVNHFRYNVPALATAGYRVYAVDLLGFGASDKPKDETYCIELYVALLRDFIQAMGSTKQWIVAGNSIGGLCCLSVADQSPEQVAGVVLFNCSGGMTGFRYGDVPLVARPILYFVQKVILGPQLGGRFFGGFKSRENVESILRQQRVYVDQTKVDDELLEILLGPADDDGAEQVFLKTFAGLPGPTPESILPTVQCPILAVWGDSDPWTPVDSGMHPGNTFGNYNDKFTLEVVPGAGHCLHDECPEMVHAKMLPWMERVLAEQG